MPKLLRNCHLDIFLHKKQFTVVLKGILSGHLRELNYLQMLLSPGSMTDC